MERHRVVHAARDLRSRKLRVQLVAIGSADDVEVPDG